MPRPQKLSEKSFRLFSKSRLVIFISLLLFAVSSVVLYQTQATSVHNGQDDNKKFDNDNTPRTIEASTAGNLDPTFLGSGRVSFNLFGGNNEYSNAIVRQPDGKIIVAGDSNNSHCLVRYNTDGSLDQTFGNLGLGNNTPRGVACSSSGVNTGTFNEVLMQPDGKIVAIGVYNVSGTDRYTNVTRFNSDGSLDTTFSGDGVLLYSQNAGDDWSNAGVIQPDGKIVMVGKVNDVSMAVIRLNTDGSLDSTFEGDGIFNFGCSGYSRCFASSVALDSVGRIVIGGYGLGSNNDFIFARILPSGAFDSTFIGGGGTIAAGTGIIAVQITTNDDYVRNLVIQPDGKIIGVGGSVVSGSIYDFTMVRLNGTDGSLDTTFDTDGKVQTNFGSDDSANSVALQSDGKIVLCGLSNSVSGSRYDYALARYNVNGSLDASFDSDGRLTTQFNANNSHATDVLIQPDGKIVASGRSNWATVDFAVARYNPNGSLDMTWGVGKKQVEVNTSDEYAEGVAQQADGKLVVVGRTLVGSVFRMCLTRFNTNGTLDTSFGTGGRFTFPVIINSDYGYALAIQPDGKIVVGGTAWNGSNWNFVLARFNPATNSLDSSFGSGGIATKDNSSEDFIYAIALLPDGDIAATGYTIGGNVDVAVLRFDVAANNWDTAFDGDGLRIIANANADYGYAIGIDSNGKIVVGGSTDNASRNFILMRLNPADGSFDTSFGGDGVVVTAISSTATDEINALTIQPDNKIVVAGYGNTGANGNDFVVARYNAASTSDANALDTSFDFDGIQVTTFTGNADIAHGVALQADGKIIASGYALTGIYNDFAFSRYNSDGSLDTTFGNDGRRTYDFSGYHDYGSGNLLVQSDGKAVAVGESYNGINWDFGVARILTNSAADCSYSLSQTSQNVVQAGASHSVNVTTTSTCTWTAVSNVSWINFTGSTNGTGNGTVAYSVAANPNSVSRTGTITIGGQTLTVTQYGSAVAVSIPTTLTGVNSTTLIAPVNVNNVTGQGIFSFDFTLTYNQTVLTPLATPYDTTGTLSNGYAITFNSGTPGTLVISGFGSTALTGIGTLINLRFNVVGTAPVCTALTFTAFQFNEGNPPSQTTNGQACVVNGSISGRVTYGNAVTTTPVPNTTITANGTPVVVGTTDLNGDYEVAGLGAGPYTVTPTKTNDVNGIAAFDAALIAQRVVNLITFTTNQTIAADVSNNGTLSSFDASLIARYVVSIPNPGITGTWKFIPASRTYPSTITNQTNENYVAILMGDVSGDWTPPGSFADPLERTPKPENLIGVSLPNMAASPNISFSVPITVQDTSGKGVIAYEFDLTYDPNVIQLQASPVETTGTLSSDMTVTINTATAGLAKVAVFGTIPTNGAGTLLRLKFTAVGAIGTFSDLTWNRFMFNENTPQNTTTNGRVQISAPTAASSDVCGRITNNIGEAVRGITVALYQQNGEAFKSMTNEKGRYCFTSIPFGNDYIVQPMNDAYQFAPSYQLFTHGSSDMQSIDFSATPIRLPELKEKKKSDENFFRDAFQQFFGAGNKSIGKIFIWHGDVLIEE